MLGALLAYIGGATIAFFQHNLQFINPYYKDKVLFLILTLSLPISYLYYYAWTYFATNTGSVWSARFIFFGLSYLVYPFLAYVFMNESPLTFKTILCTGLSLLIIVIQYKL